MKKIVFLTILTILDTVCFAQRNNGTTRTSSPARQTTVSRPLSSSPRSSSHRSTYTPPSQNRTATYSPARNSNRNMTINSRSETRSYQATTNPTSTTRKSTRSRNNPTYGRPEYNSPIAAPSSRAPHSVNHPHHIPHGMHPMPPMHHPIHHHRPIRMHHHICHDWMVYNAYWYGYWSYARSNPFNDVVVYVNTNYPSTTVVAMCADDNYVYTIYKDEISDNTYFTITDQSDNIIAKTQVSRKYCRIMTDGNGVWLLRKNNRNPIYFIYQDGNLYQYEED